MLSFILIFLTGIVFILAGIFCVFCLTSIAAFVPIFIGYFCGAGLLIAAGFMFAAAVDTLREYIAIHKLKKKYKEA